MDVGQVIRWWTSQAAGLSEDELREVTRAYWDKKKPTPGATVEQRIEWYIENLLPEELEHADQKRGALTFHACHTLALLVGHSPEPLLQAIGVFQPQRVVLLLNQWYGAQKGMRRGEEMKGWIERWLVPSLPQPLAVEPYEVADRPDAVFRILCEQVLPDQRDGCAVIVDITGAKKSMDAGAFLFAAYADIPISYVDFDDYDETYRRPFGFHCRIGTLTNPYDAFRLREWERVRRTYDNYHFRAAAGTLLDILGAMQEPAQTARQVDSTLSPFRPETVQAAETLLHVLRFYEAWDDGDYFRARQLLHGVQERLPAFSPPVAVTLLGDVWPHTDGIPDAEDAAQQLLDLHDELRTHPHSIFESNDLLIAYARDELAKVERLVKANEDNRSALLRAAGLDELLLKARLVRLWHAGDEGWLGLWDQDEHYWGGCRSLTDPGLQQKLYEALVNHQGTDFMRMALQKGSVTDKRLGRKVWAFVKLDVWRESYRARPTPDAPCMGDYEHGTGLTGKLLTQLRNQAIHMYLCVTQPVAQAAVDLARANLEEFETNWAHLSGRCPGIRPGDVERMAWDELCRLCELDFLPFTLQRRRGT
jgi:hypothetical protein